MAEKAEIVKIPFAEFVIQRIKDYEYASFYKPEGCHTVTSKLFTVVFYKNWPWGKYHVILRRLDTYGHETKLKLTINESDQLIKLLPLLMARKAAKFKAAADVRAQELEALHWWP